MSEHVCEEATGCICFSVALEPDDDCPVHGDPWPPRCMHCGKFITRAERIAPNNCPVRLRTGDGASVGRCWHHCPDGRCPTHGDVREALEHYRKTGELTETADLPGWPPKRARAKWL